MITTLAYTPFLDPIHLHESSYLLIIPLALGIAIAYKAMRLDELRDYPRQVLIMTVQIVAGMIALGLAAFLLVEWVMPMILSR